MLTETVNSCILFVHWTICTHFIYWDTFVYSYQYFFYVYYEYTKCFYMCKWAYFVFPSVYLVLVYHWISSQALTNLIEVSVKTRETDFFATDFSPMCKSKYSPRLIAKWLNYLVICFENSYITITILLRPNINFHWLWQEKQFSLCI